MNQVVYRIESMYDGNGNKVENERRMARRYFLGRVEIGSSAQLVNVDDTDEVVTTSPVKEVYIFRNMIRISTENTSYWLTPFVEEV
ncbi:hypothetical protein [Bacillus phage vB_BanS-Thrax3]|nr:hypothetical protein [Bacillus phage vB_BanS-Thrax3]